MAMQFHAANATADTATMTRLLRDFFMPYLVIRNRQPGYAVSIVKAGARIVGHAAGPVRPPLSELDAHETEALRALIEATGPQ
jgi:5-dehydro-4-deoxyglucarate dehydratase